MNDKRYEISFEIFDMTKIDLPLIPQIPIFNLLNYFNAYANQQNSRYL